MAESSEGEEVVDHFAEEEGPIDMQDFSEQAAMFQAAVEAKPVPKKKGGRPKGVKNRAPDVIQAEKDEKEAREAAREEKKAAKKQVDE